MKGIKIFIAVLLLVGLCANNAEAQSKKKTTTSSAKSKKVQRGSNSKKEVESFWKTRMWYGADVNYPTFYNGFFNMGLSPRAAYKFNKRLSAGLVIKTDYTWERIEANSLGIRKYENLNYGGGVFARARLFSGLFLQAEYEQSSFKSPLIDSSNGSILVDLNTNKIQTERVNQPYAYVGAGWSSGFDKFQTQITITRNVLDDIGYKRNPWDIKFGMSYNF